MWRSLWFLRCGDLFLYFRVGIISKYKVLELLIQSFKRGFHDTCKTIATCNLTHLQKLFKNIAIICLNKTCPVDSQNMFAKS